jgi:hypothetical protein
MPQKISEETKKARIQFLKRAIDQDEALNYELDKLRNEFNRTIIKYTMSDRINQKSTIDRLVPVLIAGFMAQFKKIIKNYNSDVASNAAEAEYKIIQLKYGKLNIKEQISEQRIIKSGNISFIINEFKNETEAYGENIFKRILYRANPADNRTIGERIKILQGASVKTVRNILDVGVRNGESAKQISNKISAFIDPRNQKQKLAPWQVYRERFGRPMSFVPPDMPAGSVAYNSLRIARTEINFTYRNVTEELNKNKPWVKGYRWNLSGSHPEIDICDDWADHGVYEDESDLPLGHPNCFCYVTTELVSEKEFLKIIKQ